MTLSEQVHKVLAYIQNIEVPTHLSPSETGRAFYENFIPLAGEKENVFLIEEQTLVKDNHPIRLRIYRPKATEKLPVIIYFHGGWFNAGSLETHDTPLRQLTNRLQAIIIAVEYRLAPEYPFPYGLKDCEFAVQWIIDNAVSLGFNPTRISIAGDSAGGALAATVARKFRQHIMALLLIYPVTDNSLKTPSWIEFQNGPLLDLKGGIQAWNWYLPNPEDHSDPDAIPLLANDFEAFPPTFIAVAEYDPLRDEAIQYAEKLKTNGVNITLNLYKGTTHGFFQMGDYIDETKVLMQDMTDFFITYSTAK